MNQDKLLTTETYLFQVDGFDFKDLPLPVDFIPNNWGINLCNVRGMEITRQLDGQIVAVHIIFIPDEGTTEETDPKICE